MQHSEEEIAPPSHMSSKNLSISLIHKLSDVTAAENIGKLTISRTSPHMLGEFAMISKIPKERNYPVKLSISNGYKYIYRLRRMCIPYKPSINTHPCQPCHTICLDIVHACTDRHRHNPTPTGILNISRNIAI